VNDGRTAGFLVQRGHLSTSVEAARALGSLIGNGAQVFLGNTTGNVWTDFFLRVDAPPRGLEPSRVAEYQRHGADSGSKYGMEKAVPGTPWLLLVEFPRDELMAPVRHFLRNALLFTLAVLVLGAFGLWRVTRSITRPLKTLHEAATAITEGDYTRRVGLNRADELGELGLAFNVMAERVARAQQALKRRLASMEDQYHVLVDGIKDYAIFMLDPQGHVVSWNEGASRIKGYRSDEVVGQHFSLFYPAEDVVAHAPWNKLEAARKAGRHEEETWLVRKDGSRFWAHVVITALRDENGDLLGFAKITRDISEKRRVAEAEALHTRALEAAYVAVDRHRDELKLANSEMEAFTYSVSHDLRAPIRQIEGFSKLLGEHLGDTVDAESVKYLERVRDGSQRMGRLVDDLLSLANLGRQDTKPVSTPLTLLVEGVVANVSSEAPGRQVEWTIGELPTTVCDPGLMKIVFTNLLSNALKYTRHKPIAVIEVGQIVEDDRVAIYVRDNGAGFDMKYVDKLFGVFQRLHRADEFEGTGIGLATVLRIIRKHNGTIWAESAVGRGSTFFFTLGTEPIRDGGSYSASSPILSAKST
jgi:PAS domain S-box-containing protein